jgi:hypothetical protein
MKVTAVPSAETFNASSLLELKLVFTIVVGIASEPTSVPLVESWSRKIGDVTPKLPSALSLFQTLLVPASEGYAPLSVAFAVPHAAEEGQTGGSGWPTARVAALPPYTLRLTTRLPGVKPEKD